MDMFETALGRLVPTHERQTVLEDAILRVLFDYRMHPQNPGNHPMKLPDLERAVASDRSLVMAALDALRENPPPLVEQGAESEGERTYRITGTGVRFVRNMPQGLSSVI